MAPQVGLEPTTDRLTADSSTTELLWINLIYSSTSTIISITLKFSRENNENMRNIYTKLI